MLVNEKPLLRVKNLTIGVKSVSSNHNIVNNVSFNVFSGQTLAIVGESGCGKSMTAKSILKIIDEPCSVQSGSVLLDIDDNYIDILSLNNSSKLLRSIRGGEIGLIFQEPLTALSPVHSISSQIIEAIRCHLDLTIKQAKHKAAYWLKIVGLANVDKILTQYPHQLSGGMRQRVLIAMALACNPKLIIADEPTTALDASSRKDILSLFNQAKKDYKLACILITHDIAAAAQVSDNIAVMYMGEIVEYGPTNQVINEPKHPYTKALLKSVISINQTTEDIYSLEGAPPTLVGSQVATCKFSPRCQYYLPTICNLSPPKLHILDTAHNILCNREDIIYE